LSAKLVPTFADRGCHVVSVMDLYGRILGFQDRIIIIVVERQESC
jgi:CBS-domain-containing membrane protein